MVYESENTRQSKCTHMNEDPCKVVCNDSVGDELVSAQEKIQGLDMFDRCIYVYAYLCL